MLSCAGTTWTNQTVTAIGLPDVSCGLYTVNKSLTADCHQAISHLRAKGYSNCTVPNGRVGMGEYRVYIGSNFASLATAGSCQVVLSGAAGRSLPCALLAEYATNLTETCSTGQGTSTGWYFPDSFTDSNSTLVIVSH